MALVGFVDRLLSVCERVFHALAILCLAILLVLNMANVASRAIFGGGIVTAYSWSVALFVWMTFFGFFVLYRQRRDITIDFLVARIGPSAQSVVRHLVNIIIIGLMVVILQHAPETLAAQVGGLAMAEIGDFELPRYTLSVPLFVSCALILIEFVIDSIKAFVGKVEPPHTAAGSIESSN